MTNCWASTTDKLRTFALEHIKYQVSCLSRTGCPVWTRLNHDLVIRLRVSSLHPREIRERKLCSQTWNSDCQQFLWEDDKREENSMINTGWRIVITFSLHPSPTNPRTTHPPRFTHTTLQPPPLLHSPILFDGTKYILLTPTRHLLPLTPNQSPFLIRNPSLFIVISAIVVTNPSSCFYSYNSPCSDVRSLEAWARVLVFNFVLELFQTFEILNHRMWMSATLIWTNSLVFWAAPSHQTNQRFISTDPTIKSEVGCNTYPR